MNGNESIMKTFVNERNGIQSTNKVKSKKKWIGMKWKGISLWLNGWRWLMDGMVCGGSLQWFLVLVMGRSPSTAIEFHSREAKQTSLPFHQSCFVLFCLRSIWWNWAAECLLIWFVFLFYSFSFICFFALLGCDGCGQPLTHSTNNTTQSKEDIERWPAAEGK